MSIFDLFKQIEKEKTRSCGPINCIVAFLGNPGAEYAETRHNAGFMVSDIVAEKYGVKIKTAKFEALCAEISIGENRVLLLKPQTYMNLSGRSVRAAADFYKIGTDRIFAVCDDVNLDVGKIRIRRKGSDGGQKGLRSIIECLGSSDFARVRIGVGKKPDGGDMVSWVLGRIPMELQDDFLKAKNYAAEALPMLINGDFDGAMSRFN